jgi:hypothetical protein
MPNIKEIEVIKIGKKEYARMIDTPQEASSLQALIDDNEAFLKEKKKKKKRKNERGRTKLNA